MRQLPPLVVLLVSLALALLAWVAVLTARADATELAGRASVYGHDPFIGYHDPGSGSTTALGQPVTWGGIAVNRGDTLGGWWRVCAPRRILRADVKACHTIRQTDRGPAGWTGRVIDVTARTARRAWHLRAPGFPTDVGTWTLRYLGHKGRKAPRFPAGR